MSADSGIEEAVRAGHDSCGTLPGTRITTLVLTLQVLVERQMTGSRTPRQR
ncbi:MULTISPECIES: hypothetical protein [unclassified Streptomyces]|uniref:hypothetical protein n=1 Tax=unclassified Streptomyces TaxID=2593676 RepID=UPI00366288C0